MLEFCKNELKKQNDLEVALLKVPIQYNLKQLSQLISDQKLLLESLILGIENHSYAQSFTDIQTKITNYYNNYYQQQMLLTAIGLGNYLPNLNPLQSVIQNAVTEELHIFRNPNFTSYHNPQLEGTGRNGNISVSSDIAPIRQSINQLTVSKSPAFFSSRAEQPLVTSLQSNFLPVSIDPTKPAKESTSSQKNIGLEKKQLSTSKKQEKTTLEEKREKSRVAAKNHRKRQNEYSQNLEDKLDALQNEEQELKSKINNLIVENKELRKKQEFLRGVLTNALTNNTSNISSNTIEEPSLNTQFNI